MSLNITNKLKKRKIIETKTTNNYITVKNYIPGESVINVTIKSSNRAGISLPESQIIDFDVCTISQSGFKEKMFCVLLLEKNII